jgi:hypothetical protein
MIGGDKNITIFSEYANFKNLFKKEKGREALSKY